MTSGQHITDEILVKYLLGEASDRERARVQQWLNYSDNNKKYFRDFKLIWTQSISLGTQSGISEDEAWERFRARAALAQKAPATFPDCPSYRWLKIAAAAALVAGGCWLAWVAGESRKPPGITENIKPAPGNHPGAVKTAVAANAPVIGPSAATGNGTNGAHRQARQVTCNKKTGLSANRQTYGRSPATIQQYAKSTLSLARQKGLERTGGFPDDCNDDNKYHGPKYDSDFQ